MWTKEYNSGDDLGDQIKLFFYYSAFRRSAIANIVFVCFVLDWVWSPEENGISTMMSKKCKTFKKSIRIRFGELRTNTQVFIKYTFLFRDQKKRTV